MQTTFDNILHLKKHSQDNNIYIQTSKVIKHTKQTLKIWRYDRECEKDRNDYKIEYLPTSYRQEESNRRE